eukprot:gene2288-2504_t
MDLADSTVIDVLQSVSTTVSPITATITTSNSDRTSDKNSDENSNVNGNDDNGNGNGHSDVETAERTSIRALAGEEASDFAATDPAALLGQSLARFSLLFNKLVETLCELFQHSWLASAARIHYVLYLYLTAHINGGTNWLASQLSLLYHERRELIVRLMKDLLFEQFQFELYYSLESLLTSYAQPVISRISIEKRLDALKEADLVKGFDLDDFKQQLTQVHSINNTAGRSMNRLQALLLRIPPVYSNLRADIFLFVLGFPAAKPDQSRHNLFVAKGRWLCNATGSCDAEERRRRIREIVEQRTRFSPDALDRLVAQKAMARQLNGGNEMNEEEGDENEENRPVATNTANKLNSPASHVVSGVGHIETSPLVPNKVVDELGNKRPRSEDDVEVKKKKKRKKREKQKNSLEGTPSSQPVPLPPTSPSNETYRTVTKEEKVLEGEDIAIQWMNGSVVDRTVLEERVQEALAKLKPFYSDQQRYESCEEAVKHLLESFFDPSKEDSEIVDLCKKINSRFVPPNCIEMRGKFREIFPSRQFVKTPRYRTVLITVREPVPSRSTPSHTTKGVSNGKVILEKEEGEISDSGG